jgi:hypothetical protein
MEFFGNIFTHYNYSTTDIIQNKQKEVTEISSIKSGFQIKIENPADENIPLPPSSPFADWKEARRYAGPLPFTFTYNPADKKVLIIEGVRENWKPSPVKVIDYQFSFIDQIHLSDVTLANAFIIHNIPYYWKKGRIEKWNKAGKNSRAF